MSSVLWKFLQDKRRKVDDTFLREKDYLTWLTKTRRDFGKIGNKQEDWHQENKKGSNKVPDELQQNAKSHKWQHIQNFKNSDNFLHKVILSVNDIKQNLPYLIFKTNSFTILIYTILLPSC